MGFSQKIDNCEAKIRTKKVPKKGHVHTYRLNQGCSKHYIIQEEQTIGLINSALTFPVYQIWLSTKTNVRGLG